MTPAYSRYTDAELEAEAKILNQERTDLHAKLTAVEKKLFFLHHEQRTRKERAKKS